MSLVVSRLSAALGAEITVVELTDSLMPGTDSDLVKIYTKFIRDRYKDIYLKTKVSKIQPAKKGFHGMNLHYIAPNIRAQFLDSLMDITNNDKYDRTTKFKL